MTRWRCRQEMTRCLFSCYHTHQVVLGFLFVATCQHVSRIPHFQLRDAYQTRKQLAPRYTCREKVSACSRTSLKTRVQIELFSGFSCADVFGLWILAKPKAALTHLFISSNWVLVLFCVSYDLFKIWTSRSWPKSWTTDRTAELQSDKDENIHNHEAETVFVHTTVCIVYESRTNPMILCLNKHVWNFELKKKIHFHFNLNLFAPLYKDNTYITKINIYTNSAWEIKKKIWNDPKIKNKIR